MLKRTLAICAALAFASISLASCTTTPDQQASAAKVYDKVCAAEPALYASFQTVAAINDVSASTQKKAEAIHASITTLCTDRPTDLIAGVATLTAAYAQFAAIVARADSA